MKCSTTRTAVEIMLAVRLLRHAKGAFRYLKFAIFLLAIIFYMPLGLVNLSIASQMGITAYEQNDLSRAKELFKLELAKGLKDAISLQYLGKIALRERDLDDAEDYIEKARKLSPMSAGIQFDAARIMGAQAMDSSVFRAPGYARKALKAYRKAAELKPGILRYRQKLMNFYLVAPGMFGGNKKLAMVEAKAIAEIDELQGLLAMASIYQNSNEKNKLETLYANAQQKFPNNAHIFLHRGKYYQSRKKYNLAIADFKKVQALKPEHEKDITLYAALYHMGHSSVLGNSNLRDGINALQFFIDTAPYDDGLPVKPWAKYWLGRLLARNGDKERSRILYKEAIDESKDITLLRKLKRVLKKRR